MTTVKSIVNRHLRRRGLEQLGLDQDNLEPSLDPRQGKAKAPSALEQAITKLASRGIALPEGTDESNFFERLLVVLTALEGAEQAGESLSLERPRRRRRRCF